MEDAAEQGENGEESEEEDVEDEEDGGEDALAGEVPGQEIQDDAEDAGVHGDCEPGGGVGGEILVY